MSEQIGIERATFRDLYKALAEKTMSEGQMPPAVRAVIEATRESHTTVLEQKKEMPIEDKTEAVFGISHDIESKITRLKSQLKRA